MDKIEILKLNVPRLRELAIKEIEGVQGVNGMNKDQLVKALFGHYGIPLEEAAHIVRDADLKKKIQETRKAKLDSQTAGDAKKTMILKKKLHDMKRVTRGWTKAKIAAKARVKKGAS